MAGMDFSYNAEQLALAEAVGKCLDRSVPAWPGRSWDEPSELTRTLMPTLGELGILGALVPESDGGAGLTAGDIVPTLVEAGRWMSPAPLVEAILAATIMAETKQPDLEAVLAGREIASVAWRGELVAAAGPKITLSGDLPDVAFGGMCRWVVATVVAADGRRGLLALDMRAPGIQRHGKAGFDLSYPLADIAVRNFVCSPDAVVWGKTTEFHSAATVLYCAELVGLASACLERSKQHLAERKQFGRALASNQVLRHMLADDLVALESSRIAVDYAGWALNADPIGAPRAVSVAKSYVSQAAVEIAENAIQVHGAMGFTWVHPLHLVLRRILRCAATLGTASEHHERLAADFLAENDQLHAIHA
jgi:alkylation response protein AidB-like acyl-CoA dehydrogenase